MENETVEKNLRMRNKNFTYKNRTEWKMKLTRLF